MLFCFDLKKKNLLMLIKVEKNKEESLSVIAGYGQEESKVKLKWGGV